LSRFRPTEEGRFLPRSPALLTTTHHALGVGFLAKRARALDVALGAVRLWAKDGLALPRLDSDTSGVALPVTQYARSADVNIAYQVVGDGALDLVWIPSMTHHVELAWESPAHARFLNRLASISRLIVFDKRGTGMSDRLVGGETLEARMDDIRMVMDAAGSERAVLFGLGDGGMLCVLFAATYPDRTSGLVLMHSTPRLIRAPELPWLPSRGDMEKRADEISRGWGDPAFYERQVRPDDPSWTEAERRGYIRVLRLSVSPGAAAAYVRAGLDLDVRDVLPLIRVPTLVLQRTEIPGMDVQRGRYLADHISSARLVELPGHNFEPLVGDQERLFSELETFLANVRDRRELVAEPDRVLATVLFTDIVDATAHAAALGDRAWRKLLEEHHNIVRGQLSRFRGREMDTAGDGFFATFDGPARGIHCACAIRESVRELGLAIRAGLHTGECELVDGKTGGIAVHIGARVASRAAPNDVLVSSTVKDLVAGSGIGFEDRGPHELKGIPGEWRLYAVAEEG
jgi:class 3 adenylate cyclase/pimeloyl-ACP methyl ester carboxylesterase